MAIKEDIAALSLDDYMAVQKERYQNKFGIFADKTPAVTSEVKTEEFNVPFTDTQFLGIGMPTERNVTVDPSKVSAMPGRDITIRDVLPLDDPDYVTNQFMKLNSVVNAQGEIYPLSGLDAAQRETLMNKVGATQVVAYDGDTRRVVKLPYEEKLSDMLLLPDVVEQPRPYGPPRTINMKDMTTDEYSRMMFANRLVSTAVFSDLDTKENAEFAVKLHGQYLNNLLAKSGLDARSRLMIVNSEMDNVARNEARRVAENFAESTLGWAMETALWAVGETAGTVAKSMGFHWGKIADYTGRQEVMDSFWKPLAYKIQDEWAQKNVIMDYATAMELASVQTGFVPWAVQLAGEIRTGSVIGTSLTKRIAEKDLNAFRNFVKNEKRNATIAGGLGAADELTDDMLIKSFMTRQIADSKVRAKWGSPKGQESYYSGRLATAFQLADASLPTPLRAEVMQQTTYLAGLHVRRDGLTKNLAIKYDPNTVDRIGVTDDLIAKTQAGLTAIERRSSVPKFVRDANVQDVFFIAGASAMGHFFEEADLLNKEMGSLVGFGAAAAVYFSKGRVSNGFNSIVSRMAGREKEELKYVVQLLQSADPLLQEGIIAQATNLARFQDILVAEGVNPELLAVTLPVLTDLVALRHFADSINKTISVNELVSSRQAKELQDAHKLNGRLNEELNRVLEGFESNATPDSAFFKFIEAFKLEADEHTAALGKQLDVLKKEGVGHYLNIMTGNTAGLGKSDNPANAPKDEEFQNFAETLDSLNEKNLIDNSQLPDDQFASVINETTNVINEKIAEKANEIKISIGIQGEVIGDASDRASSVAGNVSSGGLFEMHLVSANASAKAIASRPYEWLSSGKVQYKTPQGQSINGVPTVSVLDILQSVFKVSEGKFSAFSKVNKTDFSAAELKSFDALTEELTDQYFLAIADMQGTTKKQLVKDLAEQFNINVPNNRSPQAYVADALAKEAAENGLSLPLFDMNPSQLRELGSAFSNLKFKYKGNGAVREGIESLEVLLESKFSNFEVDGVPIERLFMADETGATVELGEYLDTAARGWSTYKSNFYDMNEGAVVPRLMSWGSQKKVGVSDKNPSGTRYNEFPDDWLNFAQLLDPKGSQQFMQSVGRAFGTLVERQAPELIGTSVTVRTNSLGYYITEGTSDHNAFKSYMSAFVADNMARMAREGVDAEDLRKAALAIEENIKVADLNGNLKPMLSVGNAIDDAIGPWQGSVTAKVAEKVTKERDNLINNAINVAAKPAKKRRKGLDKAAELLGTITSRGIDTDDIGKFIVGGGRDRYDKLRSSLSEVRDASGKLMYTEDDISTILADAYLLHARVRVFTPTGRTSLSSEKAMDGKTVFTEGTELADNPKAFSELLGGTPEERALVKEIIGERRYRVWQGIQGFLTEASNNPLASRDIALRGIPRGLSVESYVSRIFAIQRGVISPRYVFTEAALTHLRTKRFNFLQSAISNPEVGEAFLEMVRIGRPLDPARDLQFRNAVINSFALQSQIHGQDEKEVIDTTGRAFTVKATPSQKSTSGFNPNTPAGQRLNLPSLNITAP